MTGWSLFVRVGDQVTEHAIEAETRVGRGPQCQVRIGHPQVSRHHFTVRLTDGGAVLEHAHPPDQNPDGTWVTIRSYLNGVQVLERAPLTLGDIITIRSGTETNEVMIEVGVSRNPVVAQESKRSWWRRR